VLIALAQLGPWFWLPAIAYHAVLAVLVVRDAATLPTRRGWEASRDLPAPLSLGAKQEVLVGSRNRRAAGLEAALADHVPAPLGPERREGRGVFDGRGEWIAAYHVSPAQRGSFEFGPIDLRVWRRSGWWARQVRLATPQEAAVYPNVLAIRQYQLTLRRGMPYRPGQRRSRPPGAATAFAGLRDYIPGDDPRRINWKATARRDQPVTVELEAERGQQVMILLDCGRLMTTPSTRPSCSAGWRSSRGTAWASSPSPTRSTPTSPPSADRPRSTASARRSTAFARSSSSPTSERHLRTSRGGSAADRWSWC